MSFNKFCLYTIKLSIIILIVFLIGCTPFKKETLRDETFQNPDVIECQNLKEKSVGPITNIDICLRDLAKKLKEPGICKLLPTETAKIYCFEDIAVMLSNVSVCDGIPFEGNRNLCYGKFIEVERDISLCDKISSECNKIYCYSETGKLLEDSSICSKIKSRFWKPKCVPSHIAYHDDCYKHIAISKKDVSICDKIEHWATRDSCKEELK